MMTSDRVLASLKHQGVMLESGHGPVPNVVEAIAGEPVRDNWWFAPQSHRIFELTRSLRDSPDVLPCRLVNGKVTFVHRQCGRRSFVLRTDFPKKDLLRFESSTCGRVYTNDHNTVSQMGTERCQNRRRHAFR
jgi:hypothetical protein